MIKAKMLDGSYKELEYKIENYTDRTVVTISKETDGSLIDKIDFEYIENIACDGDEGYFVIPNDGILCTFKGHSDGEYISDRYEMPIFGVKTNKQCFVAVVSGMAYNYYLVNGCKDGKYYIYPRFNIDGDEFYEDIVVTYYWLKGGDANYSGMARKYREYQLGRGECTPIKERIKYNKALEYSKDAVMVRIRLGWKPCPTPVMHQTVENEPEMITACSFQRVGEIIDEFKAQGIEKAEICLVGWNTKGHDGRWPQCFPVCEELGGEQALRDLIKKAQDMGYHIVCHSNSTDTYEISEMWDENDLVVNKDGSLPEDDPWSAGKMYWICPEIALKQAKEILPKIADLGFKGLHYIDVLNIVMPRKCYNERHKLNVGRTIEINREIMKLAGELFGGYSSEGGYDFGAKYQDYALNLCHFGDKSPNPFFDEYIPIWPLVYHGIILSNANMYETLNFPVYEGSKALLRTIEYGSRPSYYFYWQFTGNWQEKAPWDLICSNDEELKYSTSMVREGEELCRKLSYLQTEFMESHEKLSDGIYCTTYSDGTKITVDYNKNTYKVEK